MRPWIVVIALAGCSHNGDTAATSAKQVAVSPCKRAADQIVDLLAMQAKQSGMQVGPEQYKQMSDTLVERCEKDHWSAEAQQCAVAAKTPEDFGRCESVFTQAQREALIQSVGGDATKSAESKPEPAAAGGGVAPAIGGAPPSGIAPGAPPPPPAAPAPAKTDAKRSPTKKPPTKASDPCEGGQ